MEVSKNGFGKTRDGQELSVYTITNKNDMSVQITDLGATLISVTMQDKYETIQDVILGYDTPEEYYDSSTYFGAVIGRSGNRIEKGRFAINGKTYQLDNVIYTGSAEQTMLSMDNELLRLCRDKRIARETAILYAVNPDALRKRLPM